MVEINNTSMRGGVNPSEIKQPIQLLAVVLGIIVVALISAAVYLSTIQIWLSSFCIFSAVAVTFYVTYKIFSILMKSPEVFDSNLLMLKMMMDFDEQKIADVNEKVNKKVNEIIENFRPEGKFFKAEFDSTIKLIKNELVNAYSDISSSEKEWQGYFHNGNAFEKLVWRCLDELKIPNKNIQSFLKVKADKYIMPDFIATKKGGKNIPIEVKYYTKRVVGNELPSKLFNQMKNYMDNMKTDESVLIVSSEVTSEALKLFNELSGKYNIHIVVGYTKEELKSQLANILT